MLSLAGLVALVVAARQAGDPRHVVASIVYGVTLILLYLASTLYHSIPYPRAKRILRVLDHSAIYLLIAGTYTPFTLISLRGIWGWTLFGLVWGMALLGITLKVAAIGRFRWLSIILYLVMGWLVLVALGRWGSGLAGRRAPAVPRRRRLHLGVPLLQVAPAAVPPRGVAPVRARGQRAALLRRAALRGDGREEEVPSGNLSGVLSAYRGAMKGEPLMPLKSLLAALLLAFRPGPRGRRRPPTCRRAATP